MKKIAASFALLLLAACSGTPSGTYAAVGEDGQIAKKNDGTPAMTLSLEKGQAVLRMGSSEAELMESKHVDGSVFLDRKNHETLVLKVDGDLLVGSGKKGTGQWDSLTFRKL